MRALTVGDAGALLSAWTSHVLQSHGIRSLLIKGVSLEHHGLRKPRVSSDVDVLVSPNDLRATLGVFRASGWRERPTTFAQHLYTEHSVALIHPLWPIDIDVHHAFPGFLAPAESVFDTLWKYRVTLPIAGVECLVPDRNSSALILALHSLRGLTSDPRHREELSHLEGVLKRSDGERDDMLELAVRTGSDATLFRFLSGIGLAFEPSRDVNDPEVRDWIVRVETPYRSSHMWGSLLAKAQGRERLRVLRHLLWPSTHDLDMIFPDLTGGPSRYVVARIRRAWHGYPVVIGMIRAWRPRLHARGSRNLERASPVSSTEERGHRRRFTR